MADEARCTPLHPENMDAICSDVRELLAPTSFHVVYGGCASVLNVDKALIGDHWSASWALWASCRRRWRVNARERICNFGCRREGGSMTGAPEWWYWVGELIRIIDSMCVWLIDSMSVEW